MNSVILYPTPRYLLRGTTTGTTSGSDGTFSITVPAAAKVLVISSVNMLTQEVNITSTSSSINVSLKLDDKSMQEVVVVGYGTQKRKEITGSIASVKGSAIASQPVQTFEQALGGRATGVQITLPSGVLNAPPVIRS